MSVPSFTLCVQLLFTQNLFLRPRSMAAGTKIKDLEAQMASGQQAYHRLPRSETVMLIALPAPAKDYLCLSITSFCFCILLAIPALLFSLKVGTIQLLVFSLSDFCMSHRGTAPTPFSPSGCVPLLVPSTPGSSTPLSHPMSLLATSSSPSSPDIGFSRDAPLLTLFLLGNILLVCLHLYRPGKPTLSGIGGEPRGTPRWPWASASPASLWDAF